MALLVSKFKGHYFMPKAYSKAIVYKSGFLDVTDSKLQKKNTQLDMHESISFDMVFTSSLAYAGGWQQLDTVHSLLAIKF